MTEAEKVEPNDDTPPENDIPKSEEAPDQEIVDRAKLYGWHDPESEDFRGDKETALGPQEFLDKAEQHPSMNRENFSKLENKVTKLTATIEQTQKDQEKFVEMEKTKAINDYKATQRKAVEDGDTEAFDRAEKGIEEAQKPITVEKTVVPELDAFRQRNDWYGTDIDKTMYANEADRILAARGLPAAEHFNELEKAINKKFPAPQAANVQRNGRMKAPAKSKTFEGMPQENKDHCNRMMRSARDPKAFKENYTTTHWSNQDAE